MSRSPSPQVTPSSAPADAAPLFRTQQLLEEARSLVERASEDAARRGRELAERTRALEEHVREMEQLVARTERQAAQLANLYVATYQLHSSLEVADVRAAVADIAVNLLGAEAFSIWLRDDDGKLRSAPESSAALDPAADNAYPGGDSLIDACISGLTLEFGPRPGSSAVAAVPFSAQGELVGVLVVERFLAHKQGLSSEDRELLELMAAHAASALLAARAFHVSQRKLQAYEGLLGFMRRGTP
jgi:nitrate/nitrite-specific signal transduction histidine kinase